ncbi:MAG: NUDIX hydrolase [Burkholderiales bacterium]|nr:NUDIX hydrolase [Burkholderiales bacterium]
MAEIIPLPAATVALVRDSARGLETLLMQRNLKSGFMAGMHLFPGGGLDAADASAEACSLCAGLDDAAASRIIGVEHGGLAYWMAAIRESFEEAGVLLAYDAHGNMMLLDEPDEIARFSGHRRALNAGEREFIFLLRDEGLRPAVDQLVYFSRWITPEGAPRRYDTRFFVAQAPAAQDALHDNHELIDHAWMNPGAALDRFRSGEFKMRTPTVKTLEQFSAYETAQSLLAAMRERRDIPAMLPRIAKNGARLLPGDPGYEEAGSTEGQGSWSI